MADPRNQNCKQFATDGGGRVIGVELDVREQLNSKYYCKSVQLIDETRAQGQTVATVSVYDKTGFPVGDSVLLSWPWPNLTISAYPGNAKIPAEHIISNKYFPPNKGPLAIYVGDKGSPNSDIVGGLGLPNGHHVSYSIVFVERGDTIDQPTDGEPDGGSNDTELEIRVSKLESTLMKIAEIIIDRL